MLATGKLAHKLNCKAKRQPRESRANSGIEATHWAMEPGFWATPIFIQFFAAAQTNKNRANQATVNLELGLTKDPRRHPKPSELKFWRKRNYGFFQIKRIYRGMLNASCSLLNVERRPYSSPFTDHSFIKHWIICSSWFFCKRTLQMGEFRTFPLRFEESYPQIKLS